MRSSKICPNTFAPGVVQYILKFTFLNINPVGVVLRVKSIFSACARPLLFNYKQNKNNFIQKHWKALAEL